jgi:hypothetical protein
LARNPRGGSCLAPFESRSRGWEGGGRRRRRRRVGGLTRGHPRRLR